MGQGRCPLLILLLMLHLRRYAGLSERMMMNAALQFQTVNFYCASGTLASAVPPPRPLLLLLCVFLRACL